MAKQFGGDQIAWNCGAVNTHKSARGAMRSPVDRASHKFLTGSRFAGDQNGRICGSNFGYTRENRVQGGRNPHDLLKHRCPIDFFAQRNVLVLEPLLSLFVILDIGRREIPTNNTSLLISHRVIAQKKPAILRVFSQEARFGLERRPA